MVKSLCSFALQPPRGFRACVLNLFSSSQAQQGIHAGPISSLGAIPNICLTSIVRDEQNDAAYYGKQGGPVAMAGCGRGIASCHVMSCHVSNVVPYRANPLPSFE